MLRVLPLSAPDRAATLRRMHDRAGSTTIADEVREILAAVRAGGDRALGELTLRFDGRAPEALELERARWQAEAARTAPEVRAALARAQSRIERFHLPQRTSGYRLDEPGI